MKAAVIIVYCGVVLHGKNKHGTRVFDDYAFCATSATAAGLCFDFFSPRCSFPPRTNIFTAITYVGWRVRVLTVRPHDRTPVTDPVPETNVGRRVEGLKN